VLPAAERRIAAELAPDALVLDVGGWAKPLARADWVIDLLPYETRGLYGPERREPERFSAATWVERDICATEPWPFPDGRFDFAVCAHTLEDVRDPVRVCEELVRVARAGYVEVPAPVEELTFGVQGPWVGWSHHHWISEMAPAPAHGLRFTFKPHLLGASGRHLPAGSCDGLAPEDRVLALWWNGSFTFGEQVLVGAEAFDPWLEGLLACQRSDHPATRTRRRFRR
jgi:hypothetical protein